MTVNTESHKEITDLSAMRKLIAVSVCPSCFGRTRHEWHGVPPCEDEWHDLNERLSDGQGTR